MPLQKITDLMYIINWCPKLFVLYVLNCTVSKLHFGYSIFPLKKLLLLRQTTGGIIVIKKKKRETKTMIQKMEKEKKTTGNQRLSAHKECWVRLMEINDIPPLFIQSDAFVG